MVEITISKLRQDTQQTTRENYEEYTDKYFLRARQILEAEGINPIVRYQIFARKNISRLKGIEEAVGFIRSIVNNKVKIYALRDGQEYRAGEPIMKIEGRVQDLIDLETIYLGILAGALTRECCGEINFSEIRGNARRIVEAAKNKKVFYFGARHFHPTLDERIARICQEEGFAGCSTDIGARAWNDKGIGTIPHALILSYAAHMQEKEMRGNATVETAKSFNKYVDKKIPRIVLIDTFNREITDSLETAVNLENLQAVRIDTCGENYAQGSQKIKLPKIDVPEKYLRGRGVTISVVWALRQALDKQGFEDVGIVVSSGFNADKTLAFIEADRVYQETHSRELFNSIGTGSLANNSIMTTSDIVAYFSEKDNEWKPIAKKGRCEIKSDRLEEVKSY